MDSNFRAIVALLLENLSSLGRKRCFLNPNNNFPTSSKIDIHFLHKDIATSRNCKAHALHLSYPSFPSCLIVSIPISHLQTHGVYGTSHRYDDFHAKEKILSNCEDVVF